MKTIGKLIPIVLFVFSFSSCKKDCDKPAKGDCRINYVIAKDIYDEDVEYKFRYTSWGAPLSITRYEPSTGNPDYFFQYDANQRLVGFIAGFDNGDDTAFHTYHRYAYENGVIVRDSIFAEGALSDYNSFEPAVIGYFTYDNHDRIIKFESRNVEDGEVTVTEYNYPNENPYVNNRSIMGTHKVLMFVSHDYSKSNQALEYNEYGYPTRFVEPGYNFKMTSFHRVVYNCDPIRSQHQ